MLNEKLDSSAIVIGGGFYGCVIALHLKKSIGVKNVKLFEQNSSLISKASYNNQARIHNGYHYPRSFVTAFRSRINFPRFVNDWPSAIKKDFTKLYAISRSGSKVSSKQFIRFCKEIGAEIEPARKELATLFNEKLIEDVFLVKEYAFNANALANWALEELKSAGIEINLNAKVKNISQKSDNKLINVAVESNSKNSQLATSYLFNCTYSGLNQLTGLKSNAKQNLIHEITEMALIRAPNKLKDIGITVMDGPFFSTMPFPAEDLHSLSHVRYTPHFSWEDKPGVCPYSKLNEYSKSSRYKRMIRDASRYLPILSEAKYVKSLFEVKTVLIKNEGDDGRPIMFEKNLNIANAFSVLGGKIDNIYDVLEKIDQELRN